MQLQCPCCHARVPLEAVLNAEAGSELLALLAGLDSALARPLVAYLGLFRSRTTQLGFDRALRLAREVLALGVPPEALQLALADTLAAMEPKRQAEGWQPLKGHNYLKLVASSTAAKLAAPGALVPAQQSTGQAAPRPTSKVGQAITTLEALKR